MDSKQMKKTPKSLQAILITLAVGMLLPNIFTLTGNTLVDKLSFKIVLSAIFALSTVTVGGLYACKIIKGRISGGRARIAIYLILVILLCSCAMPFLIAFAQAVQWIIYVVGGIAIIAVGYLIIMLIFKIAGSKKRFKATQERSLDANKTEIKTLISETYNTHVKSVSSTNRNVNAEVKKLSNEDNIAPSNNIVEFHEDKKTSNCLSLYELWENRNPTKKCLTATNDENPDLEWVKIYKPPYGNGKFYGFVKMNNARETVNGEIYFAERAIWREIE